MFISDFWKRCLAIFGYKYSCGTEHLLPLEDFNKALRKQMCRSHRNGNPLSIVVIEKDSSLMAGDFTIDLPSGIVSCAIEGFRDWQLDESRIGILLPDTSLEGAENFVEDFSGSFSAKGKRSPQWLIYTYPWQEEPHDKTFKGFKDESIEELLSSASSSSEY